MTGLGLDLASGWEGLVAGRAVARTFSLFEPRGLPTDFGVELPDGAAALFASRIKTHTRRQMTRATMIAVLCAEAALAESGLPADGDRSRIGVSVGASGTGYAPQTMDADPNRILLNMNNAPAAWISIRSGLGGPSLVSSTACASGAYALSLAVMLIQSGQCDAVVTGSAESIINQSDVGGFCSLMAMSTECADPARASRPFDRRRDGFVMGEGGGMLVLEDWDKAVARGAAILAEAHLPGLCSEAYNILSPQPGGGGMARAMGLALEHAGLAPADIGYINAHGTGTALNDLYETQAIKSVFGAAAKDVPVSSTKSMTGHTLSGAAGVEAVIAVQALVDQRIPPTINLDEPDPELDLDYVPHQSRAARLRHVMSNSFAFGGHNGVCIFSEAKQ
jgi:3-oxoacyl-[acyl-carrier-protein] synthase II